jgi:branched-chain amino acid transport system ATP-binding protein
MTDERPIRLQVSELVLSYGVVRALQSVSIDVRAGAITALVGLNGAGKSSLLKAIVGLARPTSGGIVFRDDRGRIHEVLDVRPWLRPALLGLAYVPEGRGLFPRMSLGENLSFGSVVGRRRAGPLSASQRLHAVHELFPWLEERAGTVVANLSGGEQQMAAIARALLMEPNVLLLDEPSIGLAPLIEEQMFDVLRRLADETGLAVLVAEQRLDVALSLSDHAYLLEQGRLRADGAPDELFADPELAAIYLGGRLAA